MREQFFVRNATFDRSQLGGRVEAIEGATTRSWSGQFRTKQLLRACQDIDLIRAGGPVGDSSSVRAKKKFARRAAQTRRWRNVRAAAAAPLRLTSSPQRSAVVSSGPAGHCSPETHQQQQQQPQQQQHQRQHHQRQHQHRQERNSGTRVAMDPSALFFAVSSCPAPRNERNGPGVRWTGPTRKKKLARLRRLQKQLSKKTIFEIHVRSPFSHPFSCPPRPTIAHCTIISPLISLSIS